MLRYSPLLLALAAPAAAGPYKVAESASASLTTTSSCTEISVVPDRSHLSLLHGDVSSIAGGATSITWYVALDSGGEDAITDQVTETILDEDGDASGAVNSVLDIDYAKTSVSSAGSLWGCAKTNAGTASIVYRLFIEQGGR